MTKQKAKKSEYEKALAAYSLCMKAFHMGEYKKTAEMLKEFLEKHSSEKELVDRALIYISICEEQLKDKVVQLKTFDDYYQYGVYKINNEEYEEALKLLKKALEINSRQAKIFYLMADVYCLMGKTDECLEYLKNAVQIDKHFGILAQNERDFEPLWEDKKFILITRVK